MSVGLDSQRWDPLPARSFGIKDLAADLAVDFSRSLRNKELELKYL